MKTGIKVFVVGLFMLLAGQAQATDYRIDGILSSDSSILTSGAVTSWQGTQLSGLFDFVYVGSEAGDENILFELVDSTSTTIFNNKDDSNLPANNLDIGTLYLKDLTRSSSTQYAINIWPTSQAGVLEPVHIYQLNTAVMINEVSLSAGMFLFGFEDPGGDDLDYDDLVFAARAVPLPGAAILFGSGLLGLVGLRRRQIV
ncbi:hypothetical protein NLA06_12675 [Desulfomicrobium sp. ZS1]|uniref:hypothetical protein n=1 Tax=Desulfomicrobium sp. ZS1 TaxID=2952228 RepID=UPI0020B34CAA|nr:hypothetical protein [Desulfomicrobium sp. ZS1]UTF49410.1 hypothetical protein NLA06_12675 [Desulfomicrobium sp. ZS1]